MFRDILLGVLLTLVVGIVTFLFMERKKKEEKPRTTISTSSASSTTKEVNKPNIPTKPIDTTPVKPVADMQKKPHIIASPDRGRILTGKSAVITGSTSGIGLAIAQGLAKAGANILLNGFGDIDEINKIKETMKVEFQVDVEYCQADLTKSKDAKFIVTECIRHFGSIDILCNNAGIQYTCPIDTFPEEKFHQLMALHLNAPFFSIQEALPVMKKNGWGRIINTASVHGLVASVEKSPYVSAKHGVVGLTKAVALETAGSGITVNAVAPGWVHTPLVAKQISDKAILLGISEEEAKAELLKDKMPSLEMVTEEQLADVFVFLCSSAADQITGITIPVDGGWTAQ